MHLFLDPFRAPGNTPVVTSTWFARLHRSSDFILPSLLVASLLCTGCGPKADPATGAVPATTVKPEHLGDPNQIANTLFVEATLLLAQAGEVKADSEKNYSLRSKAMQNLQKIITHYPQTTMAVSLIQDQARIGGQPFNWLEERARFEKLEVRHKARTVPRFLLQLLIEKEENFWRMHRLCSLALLTSKAGDAVGAKALLAKAVQTAHAKKEVNQHELAQIVWTMAHTGDQSGALALADSLKERAGARAWLAVADAMRRAGDKAGAKKLVAKTVAAAESAKGEEKAWMLLFAAHHVVRAGDKLEAKALCGKAVELAELLKEEERAHLWSWCAFVMARADDPAGAKALWVKIEAAAQAVDPEKKADVLHDLSTAMTRAGDLTGAKAVLAKSAAAAERLEKWENQFRLRPIAVALAEAGDTARALALAQKLEPRDRSSVLAGIVAALAKKSEVERALAVATEMEADKKLLAWVDIAEAMAKKGDAAGARERLAMVEREALQLESSWDKSRALRRLAETKAKAGDRAGALALAEQIKSDHRGDLLWELAFALCTNEVPGTKKKSAGNQDDGEAEEERFKLKSSFLPAEQEFVARILTLSED